VEPKRLSVSFAAWRKRAKNSGALPNRWAKRFSQKNRADSRENSGDTGAIGEGRQKTRIADCGIGGAGPSRTAEDFETFWSCRVSWPIWRRFLRRSCINVGFLCSPSFRCWRFWTAQMPYRFRIMGHWALQRPQRRIYQAKVKASGKRDAGPVRGRTKTRRRPAPEDFTRLILRRTILF
jgi:hypothetical protein